MKKYIIPVSFFVVLLNLCSCYSNTAKAQSETGIEPELKSVFINGDSIHYIDKGQGDPIVLVHGSLGDYRTWSVQMESFSKNHRVFAYSRRHAFPNKQIMDSAADYSVNAHASDLVEFIKALNLGTVHLVGHSYGAYTALVTTMEHPELVRSLTLGEPPVFSLIQHIPGSDTVINNFMAAVAPAGDAFKNKDPEKAVSIFITAVMGDSSYFSKLPQRERELLLINTLESRGSLFFGKNPFPFVTCNDLKKIKTPVQLIMGDKSPIELRNVTSELNRCLTNREVATLKNTSHGLNYENPVEFNKVVIEFINKY